MKSPPVLIRRCSGRAPAAMNGLQQSRAGSRGQDVRTALTTSSCRALMTLRHFSLRLRQNGPTEISHSNQAWSPRTEIRKSGGAAARDMSGRRSSRPVLTEVGARTAAVFRSFPASMISRQHIRSLHGNGRKGMILLHRLK